MIRANQRNSFNLKGGATCSREAFRFAQMPERERVHSDLAKCQTGRGCIQICSNAREGEGALRFGQMPERGGSNQIWPNTRSSSSSSSSSSLPMSSSSLSSSSLSLKERIGKYYMWYYSVDILYNSVLQCLSSLPLKISKDSEVTINNSFS